MNKGLFSDRYRYRSVFFRLGAAFLDFLGGLVTFPFRAKAPEIVPEKIKKILVIRTDAIGDTLMTYPAVTLLTEKFPQARIDFLTSPEAAGISRRACLGMERQLVFAPCGIFCKACERFSDFKIYPVE